MVITRQSVPREDVVRFYAAYDRRKKGELPPSDIDQWPWNDPNGLDLKLNEAGLKSGVVAAYRVWERVVFNVADLLQCAVVKGIFPGQPQVLSQLVLLGKIANWFPNGAPKWWMQIANGAELDVESAMIARPATKSEQPAKWYLEDGSGRALALLQRVLRYGEMDRTVWVYLGSYPDERSAFFDSRPELKK